MFCLSAISVLADESSNPDDEKEYVQRANWWHWVYRDADETDKSSFLYRILSYSEGSICPNAEDGYHKASSYLEFKKPLIGDPYYSCLCEHCGHSFKAYETDLKQSYEAQVSGMPATGFDSDGALLIRPKLKWMFLENIFLQRVPFLSITIENAHIS